MNDGCGECQSINVHIGEVKTGSGDQSLHALLGSCIGIGFLCREHNLYGLAHCLLPRSDQANVSIGGRFVDQAIHSLTEIMGIDLNHSIELEAIIAGGGNMTKPNDTCPEKLVGTLNAQTAIELLTERKIPIVFEDTGGLLGRKMTIDCRTGDYIIKQIPRSMAS